MGRVLLPLTPMSPSPCICSWMRGGLRTERVNWSLITHVTQSCPTLWDSMDSSPPGSSVHGILQARILEWTSMPSSKGSSQLRDQNQVSHIAGGFLTI